MTGRGLGWVGQKIKNRIFGRFSEKQKIYFWKFSKTLKQSRIFFAVEGGPHDGATQCDRTVDNGHSMDIDRKHDVRIGLGAQRVPELSEMISSHAGMI